MTLDSRETRLYRSSGERAVRAPSVHAAAWVLARRLARREFGRRGEALAVRMSAAYADGSGGVFDASIGLPGGGGAIWCRQVSFATYRD